MIDISTLRALQHAANGLSYPEFLEALDWPRDDYTRDKWAEFTKLGRLGVFDDSVLRTLIEFYQGISNPTRRSP